MRKGFPHVKKNLETAVNVPVGDVHNRDHPYSTAIYLYTDKNTDTQTHAQTHKHTRTVWMIKRLQNNVSKGYILATSREPPIRNQTEQD